MLLPGERGREIKREKERGRDPISSAFETRNPVTDHRCRTQAAWSEHNAGKPIRVPLIAEPKPRCATDSLIG